MGWLHVAEAVEIQMKIMGSGWFFWRCLHLLQTCKHHGTSMDVVGPAALEQHHFQAKQAGVSFHSRLVTTVRMKAGYGARLKAKKTSTRREACSSKFLQARGVFLSAILLPSWFSLLAGGGHFFFPVNFISYGSCNRWNQGGVLTSEVSSILTNAQPFLCKPPVCSPHYIYNLWYRSLSCSKRKTICITSSSSVEVFDKQ